jgi:hypothetical protein
MHELKLDGYRLQVAKDGPEVRLYSRHGDDWRRRLAALAEALQAISKILDRALTWDAIVMAWFGGKGALHDQIIRPTRKTPDWQQLPKSVHGRDCDPNSLVPR